MISVIIPVYNNEDYLYVCLNSVLKQTYQNFEVICIDDSSTDNSLDILEYFSKKDSRIKIIKNDSNKGPGYSRNKGLNLAQGKYISFLDADDWFSFNAFEILIKKAETSNLELLLFKNNIFHNETKIFEIDDGEDSEFINKFENKIFTHFDLDKNQLFELNIGLWNIFCLKSFLDENNIRFLDENLFYEYIDFFYKVVIYSGRISLIDKNLYNFRKKEIYLSNWSTERLFDIFNVYMKIMEMFLGNIQIYHYYKKNIINYIFADLSKRYYSAQNMAKKRFFIEVQSMYKNFIEYFGLYHDIIDYVDETFLDQFNFQDIVGKINNAPKISVIIPVYNTEHELPAVFDSILNQTFNLDQIEVIVIDDCSQDKSWEVICKYSKKFKNFTSLHLFENSGSPSKPRNMGIRNAFSDYIIFQDSDDGFMQDAFEFLYQGIFEEGVDMVSGMFKRNDGGDFEVVYSPWDMILDQNNADENILDLLNSEELFKFKWNSISDNYYILKDYSLNSKLIKRSLFIQNDIKFPEDLNGGEDSVVLFNSFVKAEGIVFINKIIFNYDTLRQDSLTHDRSKKTVKSRPDAYRLMYDFACLNNIKEEFINFMLQNKISYWFNEYLLKSSLNKSEIISIFKNQQILFSECVNFNLNLSKFIMSVCQDISKNLFEDAADKIINNKLMEI